MHERENYMRYKYLRFPGGKIKAVTLSYDDGVRADIRLAGILNSYGMKCTFNLNSSHVLSGTNPGKLNADEVREHMINAGHEIAVHGKCHIAPGIADSVVAIRDVLACREELEGEFDMIIRGMAYPDSGITRIHTGNSYDEIKSYLNSLGIVYSRSLSGDNNSFMLPQDFYSWIPTAHHNNQNLLKWAQEFVDIPTAPTVFTRAYPRLFYLWGHSYEFDNNNNWDIIEKFCEIIHGRDDTWYATNIEIYDYVTAYASLITSADGKTIYNPTVHEVFMCVDGKNYSVKSGQTIKIQ